MQFIWIHFSFVLVINIVIFLLLGVSFIRNYNALTRHEEQLKEAWGQIEAHLQRRYDALLSMSQVVQGYAGHEQAIDAVVAKARTMMGTSGSAGVQESSKAEHAISGFMGHVVHIATAFPELKADSHFQNLLSTIQQTGNLITQRRESFNNTVRSYNAFLKKFPTRLYAMYLGFAEAQYFSFGQTSREELPEMQFSQRAVVDGALAGSPNFPPENAVLSLSGSSNSPTLQIPNAESSNPTDGSDDPQEITEIE